MASEKPIILVSNDDGITAPGILYLISRLVKFGDVYVVAPDGPRSGMASAITVENPLRIRQKDDYLGAHMFESNGNPADCIKVGVHAVVPRKPDLIVAGINHGSNSGNSVLYSGTMGAVLEGCMIGIPSVGFSLLSHSWNADFSVCGKYVDEITESVLKGGLPKDVCLNVNIPYGVEPKGVKVCEASMGYWTEEYADYTDPHGKPYYWLTGKYVDNYPDSERYDNYWLSRGYVTVVPVRPDQTAKDMLGAVSDILS